MGVFPVHKGPKNPDRFKITAFLYKCSDFHVLFKQEHRINIILSKRPNM